MVDVLSPTPTAAGPAELLRLKSEYLIPCVYHFYRDPPQIVAAEGNRLIDHEGRSYLDCYCGVTVMSAGHGNRAILDAAIGQLRTLQHTTTIYLTEPVLRLAESLADITPGDLKRSFFCASGNEATEGAMLLATLHTGKPEIAATINGLHGRTRWAMNVTGLDLWRTDPHPMEGVHHVPFGDVDALRRLFEESGDRIAAFIAEPIQGNGGINVPGDDYWPEVRRLCDEHDVLLIFDEIQTGFNRTGRWFACEHWGTVPDIMALSKALGNGFPISAFITTDEIAASYTRPGASTSGGNPVAAAAALATIAFHREHDLGDAAAASGCRIMDGLVSLHDRYPSCCSVPRGRGLMLGLPIVNDDQSPAADRCDALLEALRDAGVLAGKTGPDRNTLTFLPPLTISEAEIGELLDALHCAVQSLCSL